MALGLLLMGLGFMFAHSSLLTMATQFVAKARGTAMSLIAFSFMVGGALGTALGGRLIEATSYREFYQVGGVAVAALTAIALVAVPNHPVLEEGPVHLGDARDLAPQARLPVGVELAPAPAEAESTD